MKTLASVDPSHPELVFALTAAIGAPLDVLESCLSAALTARGYQVTSIRLSELLAFSGVETEARHKGSSEYRRIRGLMDKGNELRKQTTRSDALALMAAGIIRDRRPKKAPGVLAGHAFILRQLKHPEEVQALRQIYTDSFWLLGLYSGVADRQALLERMKMTPPEVGRLMKLDQGETEEWGQKLRDTFHHADVFFAASGAEAIGGEVERFCELLGGEEILTPRLGEYGMFLAQAAAWRSADLSRQVGAAILRGDGEVLGIGCNEVPRCGGGQYWCEDEPLMRDAERGFDSNKRAIGGIIDEMVGAGVAMRGTTLRKRRASVRKALEGGLRGTRVLSLTEFGRAVHAEVAAILAAGRIGVAATGSTLYVTTFPCHNCAKHIVASGIDRVHYIEPYPKSLASELHDDSICLDGTETGKVAFLPFVGVAPRRYPSLFSMVTRHGEPLQRKDKQGNVMKGKWRVRIWTSPATYIEREAIAARIVWQHLEQMK